MSCSGAASHIPGAGTCSAGGARQPVRQEAQADVQAQRERFRPYQGEHDDRTVLHGGQSGRVSPQICLFGRCHSAWSDKIATRSTIAIRDGTIMGNMIQDPGPETDTCPNADKLWDADDAANFRDLCRSAFGRDCLCEGGQQCPLIPAKGSILPWPRLHEI